MVRANSHVLLDTNAIIEANRTECWTLLIGHYKLDTVSMCAMECETGNQRSNNPVPVDTISLNTQFKPKEVTQKDKVNLFLRCPAAADLDDGEKDLLAYAISLNDTNYFICSPDKACVRTGHVLGILDSFVSLEELVVDAGGNVQLRYNFTKKWMDSVRTELLLEEI